MSAPWPQTYDPLHHAAWSTLVAAVPVITLLGSIAVLRIRAHYAALLGLGAALVVATTVIGMPVPLALRASALGAAYGLLPIGWIILNVIFLYQLTSDRGLFDVLRHSLRRVTSDRRLQLVLVAFCFGSFFEGAAGFGAPVAITGALLLGLGFSPLEASGLSLIAKATVDNGKTNAPPGTAEAFQKYLDLAPNGPNAQTAKDMMASMGATVQTNFKAAPGKKK